MRRFVFALGISAILTGSVSAQGVPGTAAALSYDDVIAAPAASVGKTVSWVVRFSCLFVDVAPDGGVTNVRTLFEHRDAAGAWNGRGAIAPEPKAFKWPGPPFVDRVPQGQPRLLSGTIAAVEQTTAAGGRRVLTPVLTNITLEALPEDQSFAPGRTNGVSFPVVVREVKPVYTQEAMHEKIEGSVELRIIVRADGTVGDVVVVKSLDSRYGLDAAAIEAAKRWLFKPGLKDGVAVPTQVHLTLDFRLKRN